MSNQDALFAMQPAPTLQATAKPTKKKPTLTPEQKIKKLQGELKVAKAKAVELNAITLRLQQDLLDAKIYPSLKTQLEELEHVTQLDAMTKALAARLALRLSHTPLA